MELNQKAYDQIINDIKTCLRTLREESKTNPSIKNCLVADINTLFSLTYNIYHSYARELEADEIEEYAKQYAQTVKQLKNFESYGLNQGTEDIQNEQYWHFYFTFFDADLNKWQEMTEQCQMRYYLNPKIEHLAEVIIQIVNHYFYYKSTNKKGYFYFKFPKKANQKTIDRADKLVLYVSEGELSNFMELKLRLLSEQGLFMESTPLFTHKIAPGVSTSKTPTEEFLEKVPALWQKMFKKTFESTSYGEYMAMAILGTLQSVLVQRNIRRMTDRLALDEIPTSDFNTIAQDIAVNFVAPKAVRIMTGKTPKTLGLAA